jgi:hypothetical protein
MIERSIEVELRFDDGTNADVGSEVRVEVWRGAIFGNSSVAGF